MSGRPFYQFLEQVMGAETDGEILLRPAAGSPSYVTTALAAAAVVQTWPSGTSGWVAPVALGPRESDEPPLIEVHCFWAEVPITPLDPQTLLDLEPQPTLSLKAGESLWLIWALKIPTLF